MEYLTIDPKDPFFVEGCSEAFKKFNVTVSDRGGLMLKEDQMVN